MRTFFWEKFISKLIKASVCLLFSGHVFANSPFTSDKVMFFIGQDSGTISDFKTSVLDQDPDFPKPDGSVFYTNLLYIPDNQDTGPFGGMYSTVNFGSGLVNAVRQLNEIDGALQIGLFLKDTSCDNGVDVPLRNWGMLAFTDDPSVDASVRQETSRNLDQFIDYLKTIERDVYLRIGYEFDGPWHCYEPEGYKEGFRAIKRRIDERNATNVFTVWQSASYAVNTTDPRMSFTHTATNDGHLERWYPGDEYVDVVAMSYFAGLKFTSFAWNCLDHTEFSRSPAELRQEMLEFARLRNKPVMIAEAAPQGMVTSENKMSTCVIGGNNRNIFPGEGFVTDLSAELLWNTWYKDFFDFVYNNRDVVRAVTYINTNWNVQPFWTCTRENNCPQGFWGDSRIQANPGILSRFKEELKRDHWLVSPTASNVFTPTLPVFQSYGRLEAEFAQAPLMWENGETVSGFGLPLDDPARSGTGAYIIFFNGGEIEIESNDMLAGQYLTISFGTVTDGGQFSVLVDGEVVAQVPFNSNGLAYEQVSIPAEHLTSSNITLRLDSGFVVWFDYVQTGLSQPNAPVL